MITDHVHRLFNASMRPAGVAADACAYWNCRRPPAEHERRFEPVPGRPVRGSR